MKRHSTQSDSRGVQGKHARLTNDLAVTLKSRQSFGQGRLGPSFEQGDLSLECHALIIGSRACSLPTSRFFMPVHHLGHCSHIHESLSFETSLTGSSGLPCLSFPHSKDHSNVKLAKRAHGIYHEPASPTEFPIQAMYPPPCWHRGPTNHSTKPHVGCLNCWTQAAAAAHPMVARTAEPSSQSAWQTRS